MVVELEENEELPRDEVTALLREANVSDDAMAALAGEDMERMLDRDRQSLLEWLQEERGIAKMGDRQRIANALGRERRARGIEDEKIAMSKAEAHAGLIVGMRVGIGEDGEGLLVGLNDDGTLEICGFGQGVTQRVTRDQIRFPVLPAAVDSDDPRISWANAWR